METTAHRRVRLFKLFLNIDPAFLAGKPGQLLSLCGLQHSVDENAIALCRAIDEDAKEPENVFFQDANKYTADGKYVVTWAFNWTPAVDDWRAAVVDALTQYTAGTGDWSAVETAFVQGWATQYAKENA